MRLFFSTVMLWMGLGISLPIPAFAEDGCTGPVYLEPTCNLQCSQTACHDVSFNQDGTLFQCCPPTSIPELPAWVNPFYLALFISIGFLFWNSRKKVAVIRQRS